MANSKAVDELENNHELWNLFARTYHILAKAREIELVYCGVTREQTRILHMLSDMGGTSTLNQLATASLRRHNTISGIIQRMERANLVTRTKSRMSNEYQITITTKGNELFKGLPNNSLGMTFSTLSSRERKSFIASLNKIEEAGRNLLGIDFVPPLFAEFHDIPKGTKLSLKQTLLRATPNK